MNLSVRNHIKTDIPQNLVLTLGLNLSNDLEKAPILLSQKDESFQHLDTNWESQTNDLLVKGQISGISYSANVLLQL